MEVTRPAAHVIRFGAFELDPAGRELRKRGLRVQLPEQSLKILVLLLKRPGAVVTREEIRHCLWPDGTFVDFDHSLNAAMNRLRAALGDSAENPRFVETLQHHGYRFIASDEPVLCSFPRAVLVVLPFDNLSGDPEQEYFSDGMTEELIAQLGRLGRKQLAVIARPTAMHYKDTTKPIDEIGRELGVDYILAGSVRRVGDQVRVTAQLAQVRDQTQVWAESYDRTLSDILELQSEVAQAIAAEIKINLTPQEEARLSGARQVKPEAHELYLKGRYYWNKRTPEALKQSLGCFQQAVEKDPQDALAYAGLADAYSMLGAGNFAVLPPKKAYPAAEAAATTALRLDDTLAEAHTSLGWARHVWDWDWVGAEREYKQAIELNPSYANAHHWYAAYLESMGRYTEALAEDRKAESLDPLSLIISADVAGEALIPAGLYDQAVEQCRKTLEMDPNFPVAHWYLGTAYLGKGMYQDAFAEIQKAIDLSGGSAVFVSQLGAAYAQAGRRDDAIKMLNELKTRSRRDFVLPDAFVYIYVALDDKNQALAWLEKAYEQRTDAMTGLRADARFDSLRSDPRFKDLLRRVGLPQ